MCCWSQAEKEERGASSSAPFQSVRMRDAIIQWGPIRKSQGKTKSFFSGRVFFMKKEILKVVAF